MVIIAIGLFIFAGYGWDSVKDALDCSCNDEIDDLIDDRGRPEEIDTYDSGDYHSHTYWYWCSGYSKTFTWGGGAGCCEKSTYTFSPICY